jgi:hypothetical protein
MQQAGPADGIGFAGGPGAGGAAMGATVSPRRVPAPGQRRHDRSAASWVARVRAGRGAAPPGRRAPSARWRLWFRQSLPFVRRKLDDLWTGRPTPRRAAACEHAQQPVARLRMEHQRTQESRDKPWEQQKNPPSHGGRIDARKDDLVGPCGSAAGPPQHQEPGKRNQGEKDHGPREPDQADNDKEGYNLRHRQQNEPAGDRLHHAHRQPVAREIHSRVLWNAAPRNALSQEHRPAATHAGRHSCGPACPTHWHNHDDSGKTQGPHILLAAAP